MAYDLVAPTEIVKKSKDWSDWLVPGQAIASSAWTITPAGPTVTAQATVGNVTTVKVTGFVYGVVYCLTNDVDDDQAEPERGSDSWILRCEKK